MNNKLGRDSFRYCIYRDNLLEDIYALLRLKRMALVPYST